jgi:hypothetical protein
MGWKSHWKKQLYKLDRINNVLERMCKKVAVTKYLSVGFEAPTVTIMKNYIFWDGTPCNPVKVDRRLAGIYRFHLQDFDPASC